MSDDSESFIREVTEEVRADRARGLWKRFGPLVIGVLIAIVLAAALDAFLSHRREAAAQAAGAALIRATDAADPAKRAALLAETAPELGPGAARIAQLQRAGDLARIGARAEAEALYTRIAETAEPGPLMELAALRAAMLRVETGGAQAGLDALRPLSGGGRPFRLLALEAMGAAQLALGDAAAARESFQSALQDSAVSDALAARLRELLAVAGGAPARAD